MSTLHASLPGAVPSATLRNYIYWSTIIGVFSGWAVIHVPFRFQFFDALMLVNLFLMLFFMDFLCIAVWIPGFLLFLIASGIWGIAHGTDTVGLVMKEFSGISASAFYFYFFFRMIGNDARRAFEDYAKVAFWFTVVAFPAWICEGVFTHQFERLRGLTSEPTAFCVLVLPAYYWYASRYLAERRHGPKVLAFQAAIILSGSSNGYLCVALGVFLLMVRRARYLLVAPILVAGLLALAYTGSSNFRMRLNDTIVAAMSQDVSGANYSTYALISNLFVTEQVLGHSPLFGNGIGSHILSHDRYIGNVTGIDQFLENDSASLNGTDAASLALRTLSEFGIVGFLGVLVFVFHFYVRSEGPYGDMSKAILICFFLKFLRDGNYFEPEQFFFIFVYMLNCRKIRWGLRCKPLAMRNRVCA
jgi:hypothetical protein